MEPNWNNLSDQFNKLKTEVNHFVHSTGVTDVVSLAEGSARAARTALSEEAHSLLTQHKWTDFDQLYTAAAAAPGLPHLDIVSTPEANNQNKYTDVTSGQPPKLTEAGSYQETMTYKGIQRTFTVHLPSNYNPDNPTPMIVLMHGHGADGKTIFDAFGGQTAVDNFGAIVVTPNAIKWDGNQNIAAWQTNNGLAIPFADPDDAGFLDQMIKTTEKQVNVDKSLVGMWGFSNGGMMSLNFATSKYSKDISSFEVVSTGADEQELNGNNPMQISGLLIHGTNDAVIPINGFQGIEAILADSISDISPNLGVPNFLSANETAKRLAAKDGITGTGVSIPSSNPNLQKVEYTNGTQTIEADTVTGGTHDWYGTQEMWDFFHSHPQQIVAKLP